MRDVVGHLTFIAEFYADVIARGVQGDTALLPDRPPGDGPELAVFHAYLAERAIATRARLYKQCVALSDFLWGWPHGFTWSHLLFPSPREIGQNHPLLV